MGDYASKSVGTAGLTTGIIGTGLGLLAMHANGGGWGLFGGGNHQQALEKMGGTYTLPIIGYKADADDLERIAEHLRTGQ